MQQVLERGEVDVSDQSLAFLVTQDFHFSDPLEVERGRVTLKQAASELGVHENTVRKWIDRGILQATRLPSGHRRLDQGSLAHLKSGIAGGFAPALEIEPDTLPVGFIPAQADPVD